MKLYENQLELLHVFKKISWNYFMFSKKQLELLDVFKKISWNYFMFSKKLAGTNSCFRKKQLELLHMFKKISWNYFMCSKKLVNTILWFGQVSWKLYSISRPEHGSPHVSYKSVVHVTPVVSIEHIGCFHFFHRDIVRETALKPCVCNCMYVCHRPC